MRVANRMGMISSAVLISDDLDEIDFGFSGNNFDNPDFAAGIGQNNYFGKGITGDYDRGLWFDVSRPQEAFHTYSIEWRKANSKWGLDGRTARTHEYVHGSGDSGNYQYPQTPSKLQLGIWAGGDPGQNAGTKSWAGGETYVNGGPYTMFIRKVTIHNYNPAYAYNWTDQSGKWQSIRLLRNPDAPVGGSSGSVKSLSTSVKPSSSPGQSSGTIASKSSPTSDPRTISSSGTSAPSTTSPYRTTPMSTHSTTQALPSTKTPCSSTKATSSTSKCTSTTTTSKSSFSCSTRPTSSTSKCTSTTTTYHHFQILLLLFLLLNNPYQTPNLPQHPLLEPKTNNQNNHNNNMHHLHVCPSQEIRTQAQHDNQSHYLYFDLPCR